MKRHELTTRGEPALSRSRDHGVLHILFSLAIAVILGGCSSCLEESPGAARPSPPRDDKSDELSAEDLAVFEHVGDRPARARPPHGARVTLSELPALIGVTSSLAADAEASLDSIEILHPLSGTLYPADMASPLFSWSAEEDNHGPWLVLIEIESLEEPIAAAVNEPRWVPPQPVWEEMRRACVAGSSSADVRVFELSTQSPMRPVSLGKTSFTMAEHPVLAPLVYRQTPIPGAILEPEDMKWSLGRVSEYEPPRVILSGHGKCMNCHHSSLDGSIAGWDYNVTAADKSHFVTGLIEPVVDLSNDRVVDWHEDVTGDCKEHGACSASFARISPDGRYVVSMYDSKAIYSIVPGYPLHHSSQWGFQSGVLGIHCLESGEFWPLPGADDQRYIHSFPDWTPDGRYIVFGRHRADEEAESRARTVIEAAADQPGLFPYLTLEEFDELFPHRDDLYIIPFNEGRGGVAKPIPGGGNNGRNNYHPRASPDGRWIVYNQSNSGVFLRPDADLYIIPLEGGEPRRLAASSDRMDSWHSWSPNGRWVAFSSKRDGPYTNVYVTHISDDGDDSPAVLLHRLRTYGHAVQLPEFFNIGPDDLMELRPPKR